MHLFDDTPNENFFLLWHKCLKLNGEYETYCGEQLKSKPKGSIVINPNISVAMDAVFWEKYYKIHCISDIYSIFGDVYSYCFDYNRIVKSLHKLKDIQRHSLAKQETRKKAYDFIDWLPVDLSNEQKEIIFQKYISEKSETDIKLSPARHRRIRKDLKELWRYFEVYSLRLNNVSRKDVITKIYPGKDYNSADVLRVYALDRQRGQKIVENSVLLDFPGSYSR